MTTTWALAQRRVVVVAALCAGLACRGLGARPEVETPVVLLVSASAEWRALKARFPHATVSPSPYGEWLRAPVAASEVTFFHGGYGKVAAAGSTQFVIDRFHPRLLVNLGTCGGFEGEASVGDVVVASGTVIYDIVELMGDSSEAIAGFSTALPSSGQRGSERRCAAPCSSRPTAISIPRSSTR